MHAVRDSLGLSRKSMHAIRDSLFFLGNPCDTRFPKFFSASPCMRYEISPVLGANSCMQYEIS